MSRLEEMHCVACQGDLPILERQQIAEWMLQLAEGWQVSTEDKQITKRFHFKNFYETMAFANAIAWMAHCENHHPDLEVSYRHCTVHYSTHAINGLSRNDFICAKKVDQIIHAAERNAP